MGDPPALQVKSKGAAPSSSRTSMRGSICSKERSRPFAPPPRSRISREGGSPSSPPDCARPHTTPARTTANPAGKRLHATAPRASASHAARRLSGPGLAACSPPTPELDQRRQSTARINANEMQGAKRPALSRCRRRLATRSCGDSIGPTSLEEAPNEATIKDPMAPPSRSGPLLTRKDRPIGAIFNCRSEQAWSGAR